MSTARDLMAPLLFAFAALTLLLIPLAPKLVRLRIRLLKWFRWKWAVNLLERHFTGWVWFVRVLLFGIAVAMILAGLNELGG